MIPHRAEGALDLTVLTHGASQPEARGLYGGYPSSIQARILFHGSNLREEFAKGRILGALDEVGCERVEVLAAKQRTQFLDHDALLVVSAGGGGYGDPLERDPQRVLNDIRLGLVSPERARELYGVDLEHPQSDALRQKLRAHRLEEGAVVHALNADKPFEPGGPKVGRALVVGLSEGESVFACAGCHYVYGPTGADPKSRALMRERSIAEMSPWNRYGATEDFVVRQFYCPRCARMMGVEMRLRTDPILADTVLAPGS